MMVLGTPVPGRGAQAHGGAEAAASRPQQARPKHADGSGLLSWTVATISLFRCIVLGLM